MNVNVLIGKEGRALDLPEASTPGDALSLLGLLPDAYIVLRGKMPIPMDERLAQGETIKLIKVASGG